jgi:hypothetical protein
VTLTPGTIAAVVDAACADMTARYAAMSPAQKVQMFDRIFAEVMGTSWQCPCCGWSAPCGGGVA